MAFFRSLIVNAGKLTQLADTDQLYSEAWNTPALQNSWQPWETVNPDGLGLSNPGYYRDPYGVVHLQGVITGGSIGTTIFTLPTGYRPNRYLIYPVITGSTTANYTLGVVHVKQDGTVVFQFGGTSYVALDPIQFRTY